MMELIYVAKKYKMDSIQSHIRDSIARQNLLPTRLKPAVRIYALAQKYGLQQEALQASRTMLKYPMTLDAFDNLLDIIPGAYLYELWKYHERVRAILAQVLREFRTSCARGTIKGLHCTELSSSQIPGWLDDYIESIGNFPHLFDSAEFNIAMAHHAEDNAGEHGCGCSSMPSWIIRNFWEALQSVVDGAFIEVSTIKISSSLGC
jgi:hypothetical protein